MKGRYAVKKKFRLKVSVISFLLVFLCFFQKEEAVAGVEPELTHNDSTYNYDMSYSIPLFGHDYGNLTGNASSIVTMYLSENTSGYQRIEYTGKNVVVEQYSFDFQLLEKKYLECEMDCFAGSFIGHSYNFLVFGQDNTSCNDQREVIRIVKYDKYWKRLADASIYGEEIQTPFFCGGLRMDECEDQLYIHTCQKWYNGHQGNLFLQLNQSDMRFQTNSSNTHVSWNVSHSMNQFILVDDEKNIITLNHGDAGPRGAILGKYGNNNAGTDSFFVSQAKESVFMLDFGGSYEVNRNRTNAKLGGLIYSTNNYLAAGASVDQNAKDWSDQHIENVFVSTVSKQDFKNGVNISWLTSYEEGGNYGASNPYIVKVSGNMFLVLWAEMLGYNEFRNPLQDGKIFYVFIDEDGRKKSEIYEKEGYLSDCEPIYAHGQVVWYSSSREGFWFNTIDLSGNFQEKRLSGLSGDTNPQVETTGLNGSTVSIKWNKIKGVKGYHILRRIVRQDSNMVQIMEVEGEDTTSYIDHISSFVQGDICEYIVCGYNDKFWSRGKPVYIELGVVGKGNPQIDDIFIVDGIKYKVTELYSMGGGEVNIIGYTNDLKGTVKISGSVRIDEQYFSICLIENKAFQGNAGITKVVIDNRVYHIGKYAFKNCKRLKAVHLNSHSTTKIGAYAFQGCKILKKINVKSDLLSASGVKDSLKGSSVKTIKLDQSLKYKKNLYKNIFTKKNCGKKVTVE